MIQKSLLLFCYYSRVSHRSYATRCLRMLVHKNYEAYELQFCKIITLDHLHPAHQVLWNFIKDYGFGEPISGCPNSITFRLKVWIFEQQLSELSKSTDLIKTWYAVKVVTQHLAYQILADSSKPFLSNRGMCLNV